MVPNINPIETGYIISLVLLMFILVAMVFPMSVWTRSVVVCGSIVMVVGALGSLNMLPF